jgi:hypothetical protein
MPARSGRSSRRRGRSRGLACTRSNPSPVSRRVMAAMVPDTKPMTQAPHHEPRRPSHQPAAGRPKATAERATETADTAGKASGSVCTVLMPGRCLQGSGSSSSAQGSNSSSASSNSSCTPGSGVRLGSTRSTASRATWATVSRTASATASRTRRLRWPRCCPSSRKLRPTKLAFQARGQAKRSWFLRRVERF